MRVSASGLAASYARHTNQPHLTSDLTSTSPAVHLPLACLPTSPNPNPPIRGFRSQVQHNVCYGTHGPCFAAAAEALVKDIGKVSFGLRPSPPPSEALSVAQIQIELTRTSSRTLWILLESCYYYHSSWSLFGRPLGPLFFLRGLA